VVLSACCLCGLVADQSTSPSSIDNRSVIVCNSSGSHWCCLSPPLPRYEAVPSAPPPPQPTVTSISLRTGIWLAVRCVLRFGISRLLMSITEHCLHTQGGPGKSRLIIFATIYNTLSVNTLALTLKIEALALSSEALALASCLLSFDLPAWHPTRHFSISR